MRTYVLLTLALLLAAPLAMAQEDMRVVSNKPFPGPQRPPAAFNHDQHNEKAKIEDCAKCHHGEEQGRLSLKNTSEGQPCVECHPVKAAAGRTPLMRAFHRQCAGCHETAAAGPLTCGECHQPTK